MYKLPVDPYYFNAANWWLQNRNHDNEEFKEWMKEQGTLIKDRDAYYPWLDFEDSFMMTLFRIRWADSKILNNDQNDQIKNRSVK